MIQNAELKNLLRVDIQKFKFNNPISIFDGPGSNVLCREHQLECVEYGGMGKPTRPHTFYRGWECNTCGYDPREDESIMEIEQIMQIVERIGLPAVIIGIMCWYIFKTQQSHKEEIIRWEEKDTRGDERLIDVIKEQNKQNSITSDAVNGLSVAFKDVAKTNERLSMEIKGMAEALIANKR